MAHSAQAAVGVWNRDVATLSPIVVIKRRTVKGGFPDLFPGCLPR